MFRKTIVYIILFSMVLHCACRLGFLNELYQKRHSIAYTIGLIAEVPIAMCASDFNFVKNLTIDIEKEHSALPSPTFKTTEINLFYLSITFHIRKFFIEVPNKLITYTTEKKYTPPDFSIFHPPSVS